MFASIIDISESINVIRTVNRIPHSILTSTDQICEWITDLPRDKAADSEKSKTMALYGLPVRSIDRLSKKEMIDIFCRFDYMSVFKKQISVSQKFICGTTNLKQDCLILFN